MTDIDVTARLKIIDETKAIFHGYNKLDYIWSQLVKFGPRFEQNPDTLVWTDKMREDHNLARQELLKNDPDFQKWTLRVNNLLKALNEIPISENNENTRKQIDDLLTGKIDPNLTECSNELFVMSIVRTCLKDGIPLVEHSNWRVFADKYTPFIAHKVEETA